MDAEEQLVWQMGPALTSFDGRPGLESSAGLAQDPIDPTCSSETASELGACSITVSSSYPDRPLHKRSVSCSAILQGTGEGESDAEVESSPCSLSGSHVSLASAPMCSSSLPAIVDIDRHHHHHHHKHKHHHHNALSAGDRSRSCSADDLPSTRNSSNGSSANFIAVLEDRRPKSFTSGHGAAPRAHHHRHTPSPPRSPRSHHQGHNQQGLTAGHSAGSLPRPKHATHCKQQHASSSGGGQAMAHVANGRRSPLQQAMHKQQLLAGFGSGGYAAAGGTGTYAAGSSGGAQKISGGGFGGFMPPLVPKLERVMAESLRPDCIAKGFAGRLFSRRAVDVFNGSRPVAAAAQLVRQVPTCPGLHLWVVKPPRSRQWVPLHLGSATNLQQTVSQYLHDDGSCGPAAEPHKYRVMMDLMCRGFAVQVRFRPAKSSCASVKEDELAKLRLFDFPLNDKDNGGCRPIELPNGWLVVEYPVAVRPTNELYEQLFGPRRML